MQTQALVADNLNALSRIRHAFFTKAWGNGWFSGHASAEIAENARATMAAHLGVPSNKLLTCDQIHSPEVAVVTEIWQASRRPQADGLVTNKAGIALGVLTADCVPVLFADGGARVIGAAHAGWRGALGGIVENTVLAMENLGACKGGIHAALGPCISQNSYEVGPEFPAPFLAENPSNEKFFRPAFKSDRYTFDLPGYIVAKLRSLGLASVAPSPADTCADPERFFSHRYSTLRNEKRSGNLMSAIALVSL